MFVKGKKESCCELFFKKIGHSRPLLFYFRPFQTILKNKNSKLSGIRTRIVRVEGENADHLTTATARQ